jgi:hypothetical protein
MEIWSDFFKILIPGSLVLLGIYLTVDSLLKRQFEKSVLDMRSQNTKVVLPVRMQAYERMAMFLERISAHNLILRVNQPNMTSAELQALMLQEIREEFNHNMSQQIYMSEVVWTLIRNASEEIISVINTSAQQVDPERPSIELARRIFDHLINQQGDSIQKAMSELKREIGVFF